MLFILFFNLPKNVSNGTSPQGQQLVLTSLHYCTSYGPDKSGWTHGCTDAGTYTEQKLKQLCLTYPQAGSTKSKHVTVLILSHPIIHITEKVC